MKKVKNNRQWGIWLLICGLILIGTVIYKLPGIWINKSDLIQVKGTLDKVHTNITLDFYNRSREPNKVSMTHKSELIFNLNEHTQEYYLTEYVGEHYIDEKYEIIRKGLRDADGISVWIKKSEEHLYRPQVFQIDNNEATLLNFEHLHIRDDPATPFFFAISFLYIIFVMIYFAALFRNKFRKP